MQFPSKETHHISTHAHLPQSHRDDDDDDGDDDGNDDDDYGNDDDGDGNDDDGDDDDDDDDGPDILLLSSTHTFSTKFSIDSASNFPQIESLELK